MPWKEVCLVSIREEFVLRALEADANHAALCREYGIARKTGYKWIDRFQQGGVVALRNLDRRPLNSPLKVNGDVVAEIVKVRRTKRRWGARKIAWALEKAGLEPPSERTINRVLARCGFIEPRRRKSRRRSLSSWWRALTTFGRSI